jgi:hypothetical protein
VYFSSFLWRHLRFAWLKCYGCFLFVKSYGCAVDSGAAVACLKRRGRYGRGRNLKLRLRHA